MTLTASAAQIPCNGAYLCIRSVDPSKLATKSDAEATAKDGDGVKAKRKMCSIKAKNAYQICIRTMKIKGRETLLLRAMLRANPAGNQSP